MSAPELALAEFLRETGLAEPGEEGEWTPLTGGVSSDIWRVETRSRCFCVKRALPQLRVAAEWKASIDRNAFEWEYMQVAEAVAPGSVPHPIAQDTHRGLFAMAWLDPKEHVLWKAELLAGRVDPTIGANIGKLVGRIHAATANDPSIPARFATDVNFNALRIEPYLLVTGRAHPDLAERLEAIADCTVRARYALVHGDVSPKNILVGPSGPVILDAECAWFGDPAFDLAFCLTHLAVKQRVVAGAAEALIQTFDQLIGAYLEHVRWEAPTALEARAAALLPALILARIDGKSPLEYLNESQRSELRVTARKAVLAAPETLDQAKDLLTS